MIDEVSAPPILELKEATCFHCPETEIVVNYYQNMVNYWNSRKPQFRIHHETTAIRQTLDIRTIRSQLKIPDLDPEARREILNYLLETAPDAFNNWFEDGTLFRSRSDWNPFLIEAVHVMAEAKKRIRLAKNSQPKV